MKMPSSKRYLAYVLVALVPQLHGCLWESIHVDGRLDASNGAEEVSTEKSEENSTNKDDNI